ncbi:MAG: ATP-binding protein, partial [Rhabdochlamydiaceae bacterium]
MHIIQGKATTVIGPRRAGKTSLLLERIAELDGSETLYLDFEDIALKGISASECLKVVTELFSEVSGKKVRNIFLDEVQNLGDWQSLIRTLLDRGYNVYATGSSSRLLSRELATQLRGRSNTCLLLPFSFSEVLTATNSVPNDLNSLTEVGKLKNALSKYLEYGGYPEVVLKKDDRDKLLGEYKELIFLKDFVERQDAKSIEVARFVFNFVTQCFSSEMSVRRIINELSSNGIPFGSNTVYDYTEKLQDTMIFFFLERYSTKVSMRAGWPKKVYLADNGLSWRLPYDKGRLIENAVFLHLKRRQRLEPIDELYYYRDKVGKEVDFVVKKGQRLTELIQVTYASDEEGMKRVEIESLLDVGKTLGCKKLTIITWDYENVKKFSGQSVSFIPLWKWLISDGERKPINLLVG